MLRLINPHQPRLSHSLTHSLDPRLALPAISLLKSSKRTHFYFSLLPSLLANKQAFAITCVELHTPVKTMASSSMVNSAVVILAVMSSVAIVANAQAPAPAPTSGAFSIVPSVLAPAMGMLVAFFASRMLW